jgi:hypothetical protein
MIVNDRVIDELKKVYGRVPGLVRTTTERVTLGVLSRAAGLVGTAISVAGTARRALGDDAAPPPPSTPPRMASPGLNGDDAAEAPVDGARAPAPKPTAAAGQPATKSPSRAAAPAPKPAREAVEAGAPGTATATVERIGATVDAEPGATLAHDELPLDDYDHLTLAALRARLAKLDVASLIQLRDYERTHANRLSVVTMFENRIAKLGTADSAAS